MKKFIVSFHCDGLDNEWYSANICITNTLNKANFLKEKFEECIKEYDFCFDKNRENKVEDMIQFLKEKDSKYHAKLLDIYLKFDSYYSIKSKYFKVEEIEHIEE